MINSKTILIDADDTLWYDNLYYQQLKKKLFDLIPLNSRLDAEKRFRESITSIGVVAFIEAIKKMAALYRLEGDGIISLEEGIAKLRNYPIVLLPYVSQTLPKLMEDKQLILVTVGDFKCQMEKISRSNLQGYFGDILIVPQKDDRTWKKIYDDYDLTIDDVLVIGNSLKSDIYPNIKLGAKTIFLDHRYNAYGHDMDIDIPICTVNSWKKIFEIIE